MLPFLVFSFLLFSQSYGELEDDFDMKELFKRLQKMDDLADRVAKLEVEDPDVEERLAKLEDLAKIGTLRSCYEYSQYGLKTSGAYMIDPDGGLIGQEPFQVLDRWNEMLKHIVNSISGILQFHYGIHGGYA